MTDLDTAIASFAPAAIEDVKRSALQHRLTTKFLLPAAGLSQLVGDLAAGYTVLEAGERRAASYRTLHFDTEDLVFFHAHRRGRMRRAKVRIRHYDDRKLSYFEVKQRFHEFKTVKQRKQRDYGDNELLAGDRALAGRLTGVEGTLYPQVWTLFRRLTLVGMNATERVTLDFNLRFGDGIRTIDMSNVVIVEVKQPRLCRQSPVMDALRRAGVRPGRISKYCAAMTALHAEIRHNRLRPQFRAMEAIEHA